MCMSSRLACRSGHDIGVVTFRAAISCDPIDWPSLRCAAAETWGDTCSKDRGQAGDRVLWKSSAHGKKTRMLEGRVPWRGARLGVAWCVRLPRL
jgi:hypothetical protein